MKAKQHFIYFNLTDNINYNNLLKLYSIATYNKKSKRYDTIKYKTQKQLANELNIKQSSLQTMINYDRYNDYFIVDKDNKVITLLNDFSQNNKRQFVVITASQLQYLINDEAVITHRNLFIKYYLYIKYFSIINRNNRLDFTANQFLTFIGYSCKSNNTKDILGKFNKTLVNDGYLNIKVEHDNKGHQRNYYRFIYD